MHLLLNLWKNGAIRDLAVALVGTVILSWIAVEADVFDRFFVWSRQHEDWELDELVTIAAVIGLCGFVFAVRRLADLRSEVTRRTSAEYEASWIAFHDPLTNLPNRRFLEQHLSNLTAHETVAVFNIDLDGFKKVNDLVGHHGGDQLLRQVADSLVSAFPHDLVVRLGGDEFVLVKRVNDAPQALAAGTRLERALHKQSIICDTNVSIGGSVGIALYPDHSNDPQEILRFADLAMYSAKRERRGQSRLFDPSIDAEVLRRTKLESELRAAIVSGAIVPHYQPLYEIQSGKLTGFEALARWTTPDGLSVAPSEFIVLAEQCGLIVELSEQLLRQACSDALNWPNDIKLAFNISPQQITDHLLGLRIIRILEATGFPARRLEIEITESALMADLPTATKVLSDLQAAGITIALDDFGTGYSSLAQLSNFTFDKLKIDRSFIASFRDSSKQMKIVQSIIGLGHGLGITTTAEGIENADQLASLAELGCDFGQGFLMSRPVPADAAMKLIEARHDSQRAPHRKIA